MRKTFAQVLQESKFNVNKEYERIYTLFYKENLIYEGFLDEQCSMFGYIQNNFRSLSFRHTELSLDDFDKAHHFTFADNSSSFDLDYLISFCEYCINMYNEIVRTARGGSYVVSGILKDQITKVIEDAGYMPIEDDNGLISYVPKLQSAIAASEILPAPSSYNVIFYNHHSLKGDIEAKKIILKQLADLLEPKQNDLAQINSTLKTNIFYAFNNCNIRHNNIDSSSKSYKKSIAELSDESLESVYDELYQMCLLAFLELDNVARTKVFEDFRKNVEEESKNE